MVNTGKPSNGCVQCRARRVKFDGSRRLCERCRKYGIVGPGYPKIGLVFRDLTVAVREKAAKKYEKNHRIRARTQSPAMHGKRLFSSATKVQGTSAPVSPQIYDICAFSPHAQPDKAALVEAAVAAFLSQWSNSNVDVWWGVLDMATIQSSKSMLKGSPGIALQAVSFMALALRPELKNCDMKRSAAMMYGTTLRAINSSLLDPKESLEDHTFIAVMLTALFESMDEVMEDNPAAAHIRGMMSLINARGPSQFRSATGRRIFLYTYFTWRLTNPSDRDFITSILCEIYALDHELLAWNLSLPHGVWGEQDRLYQMLTTSWFRTHRIFLADLSIRCYERLAELDGQTYDNQIWRHVDEAQNAVDNICVRIPYSFAPDNPRKRKPSVLPRIVPDAKITYLYHASFEYPLLVASMVWTLPPFRQKSVETARKQCANACGLAKPRRKYPKVLVYLTPDARERYIRFRTERAQRWLLQGRTDAGSEFPFRDPVTGKKDHI